ncbi:MAG: hypothetical protein O3C04_01350 [Crenarchaeota archaeon]|nr:hypothetical protein [Thermoproteota archaeon]MDA1124276.1 hypothetical protein [Thermoproteota archaeon]
MEKRFPITIIAIAIVGFSASTYFFSQTDITIESPISLEIQSKTPLMHEIESCIEQNLVGENSIALNSFNTNMLLTLKEAAMKTEDKQELEQLKQKLYTLTNCEP